MLPDNYYYHSSGTSDIIMLPATLPSPSTKLIRCTIGSTRLDTAITRSSLSIFARTLSTIDPLLFEDSQFCMPVRIAEQQTHFVGIAGTQFRFDGGDLEVALLYSRIRLLAFLSDFLE